MWSKVERMSNRYKDSEAFLERAKAVIPLGAQTFSKSVTQFPHGVSPYFATRGQGSRVWDLDGNEYIDFVSALCSITLGYADADVNQAVAEQLSHGTIFTLSHPLETQVAEKIVEMVPCAEAVRFGKNGSDATSGAIRVARAHTQRDHILVCGYHGWQDWYIGSTARNLGVPEATRALTHTFPYGDLPALEILAAKYKGSVAAIILEPMNVAPPPPGYLEGVRDLATREGIVLVFDETITGFRFANGGAQELFGVTPDLATFGKGVANGFPLSVVAGKAGLMRLMEEVFFSFTMGGETLSLAAALATLQKLQREPVVATLRTRGQRVIQGVNDLISKHGVGDVLSISGDPTWTFLLFKDTARATSWELKTLWMQELLARSVLSFGTHNISYAHSETDIDSLLAAYDEIFPILHQAAFDGALRQYLKCEPLQPLFKVR